MGTYYECLEAIEKVFELWKECWELDAENRATDPLPLKREQMNIKRKKAYLDAEKAMEELAKHFKP